MENYIKSLVDGQEIVDSIHPSISPTINHHHPQSAWRAGVDFPSTHPSIGRHAHRECRESRE